MISKLRNLPNKYLFYVGILFVVIFISLAYWQFDRYLEDQELTDRMYYSDIISEPNLSEVNNISVYAIVKIQENLTPVKSWLLRSRVNNGLSGFHIITIYKNDKDEHLLINRGWVPLAAELLNYEYNSNKLFTGKLYEYDQKPTIGQDDVIASNFIFRIDKNFLENEIGVKLPDYYLQLTIDCGVDIVCINPTEKYQAPHLGYTFQWLFFALCLTIVIARKNKLI
jgi:cytochrome oxidase assembly protein ShyY1